MLRRSRRRSIIRRDVPPEKRRLLPLPLPLPLPLLMMLLMLMMMMMIRPHRLRGEGRRYAIGRGRYAKGRGHDGCCRGRNIRGCVSGGGSGGNDRIGNRRVLASPSRCGIVCVWATLGPAYPHKGRHDGCDVGLSFASSNCVVGFAFGRTWKNVLLIVCFHKTQS